MVIVDRRFGDSSFIFLAMRFEDVAKYSLIFFRIFTVCWDRTLR